MVESQTWSGSVASLPRVPASRQQSHGPSTASESAMPEMMVIELTSSKTEQPTYSGARRQCLASSRRNQLLSHRRAGLLDHVAACSGDDSSSSTTRFQRIEYGSRPSRMCPN